VIASLGTVLWRFAAFVPDLYVHDSSSAGIQVFVSVVQASQGMHSLAKRWNRVVPLTSTALLDCQLKPHIT
jgi:hypothetical protein